MVWLTVNVINLKSFTRSRTPKEKSFGEPESIFNAPALWSSLSINRIC